MSLRDAIMAILYFGIIKTFKELRGQTIVCFKCKFANVWILCLKASTTSVNGVYEVCLPASAVFNETLLMSFGLVDEIDESLTKAR